jgi:hypothetical protein
MKKTSGNHLAVHSYGLVLASDCLAVVDGGAETQQEGGKVAAAAPSPVSLQDSNNLTPDHRVAHYKSARVTNFEVHGSPGVVNQGNVYNTYNNNYYSC